jgi:hypothetical protein
MSRVYLLREKDFEDLLTRIDRDPQHGLMGGSSAVFTDEQRRMFIEVHRFYNYQVHGWVSAMKEGE